MKKGAIFIIFALICFWFGFAWYVWTDFVTQSASASAEEVIFEVTPGEPFAAVVKDLSAQGLVSSPNLFSLYVKIKGATKKIKVGEYAMRKNMTPQEVLQVLESGKSIQRSFTVIEGLNIYEIAEIYERFGLGKQEEFMSLCHDSEYLQNILGEKLDSCEGYLFPETYKYTKFTTLKELMTQMLKNFLTVYSEVSQKSHLTDWSRHKIVTLASIVEKETGAPEERQLVSAVFHNRLKKDMMLQTDPTIIYGKAVETGKYEIKISREDIHTPTKYNTYAMKGLPPGPIANPGKEALLAAMTPAQTKDLFFVSQNNGRHIFSESYEQHNKAVKKFQQDPSQREGKSWRDLKKEKK